MRVKVTEQGLVIPKELLEGIQEVEIRREEHQLILVPMVDADPTLGLGSNPIRLDATDASENHDTYLSPKVEPEPMLSKPQLLPLPVLEGVIPSGWKDAI